ncbi:F-box domain-containing protein [Favolaschia claudopus]|uniref:F-box domain-containing protein n=1 Tax=Favolaschia claudopus TaxID=2862362 RepID=A0AAW0AIK0_9AGAR
MAAFPPVLGRPTHATKSPMLWGAAGYGAPKLPRPWGALGEERVRLADIDTEIADLKRSIKLLRKEQRKLQDRVDGYKYPVLTLPNEIVSEFFVAFMPPYPQCSPLLGRGSPLILSHICRKWRNIAFATPALWRAISLDPLRSKAALPHAVNLFMTSLILARSCPLSMNLQSRACAADAMLAQALENQCGRLEHLEIHDFAPPQFLDHPFPILRTLKLGSTRGLDEGNSTPMVAPLLRKVSILCDGPGNFGGPTVPWAQLTVLSIKWITVEQCAAVLRRLVNIVHCRLRVTAFAHRFGQHNSGSDSIYFPNMHLQFLESLIFEGPPCCPRITWALLSSLTAPALKKLQLCRGFFTPAEIISSIMALISRSGCTLEQLCIPDAVITRNRGELRAGLSAHILLQLDYHAALGVDEPFLEDMVVWDEDEDEDEGRTDCEDDLG